MAWKRALRKAKPYSRMGRLAGYASTGLKYAQRAYGMYSMIKGANRTTSGVGITSQHDYKRQYRRRRMPRRKRKAWGMFVRKVRAANMKLLGTKTVLFNTTVSNSTPNTSNTQAFMALHLMGRNGTSTGSEAGCSDLQQFIYNDSLVPVAGKVLVGSSVMDITFRNVPPAGELTSTRSMELDVYEVGWGDETQDANFATAASTAQTDTLTIGSGAALTLGTRGTTLFDLPQLIKNTKMKIFKKTKIFLPIGQTTTYQLRNPKNYVVNKADVLDSTGWIQPYKTRSVIAVFKPVISQSGDFPFVVRLDAGVTRKYMYKVMDEAADADAVL